MNKKHTKKPKIKKVTRKFLLDLANRIYNPKTRVALRLCKGKLKNGPDPEDKSRTMHCGLGELYFQMTGRHPEFSVTETNVADLAVRYSTLQDKIEGKKKKAEKVIRGIEDPYAVEVLLGRLANADIDFDDKGELIDLKSILTDIPDENDSDGIDDEFCSLKDYKARARRVANVFKRAAKLLPV